MTGVLVVFILILVLASVVAPIVYMRYAAAQRKAKAYERGLKMVPLYIHLPPTSDDADNNGRDVRDMVDENISKAQVIYNIVASTTQKGRKQKMQGQRHFAFEIIGSKGFVYLYAAVPVSLVDVVKQAISSAYPSARLEEVSEHNIFNQVGKLNGVAGGELELKQDFAYPIATYQDLKRDALQSILNALSTLDKEDGAAIQIIMRPAEDGWRKQASGLASKKRKGEDGKTGLKAVGGFAQELATAAVKTPESKDEPKKPKELSQLEQATLDAIDEKTRYAGFEVTIRIVASSNISQRSQAILSNIVAAFSLFDAPGKNGFKYVPAKDPKALVTDYVMRFFSESKKKNILNAVELATLFHFPDQKNIPTSQLTRQDSKQVDGPRNMPDDGTLLGYNVFRGAKKPIRLSVGDRQRHMYVVGQTGTGKSTYLENLALQDMLAGNGFAFVDPHGDTAEKLLAMVPRERTEDVIYFSPADMDFPMGLNLFEYHNPDQIDFIIQEVLNMLYKLYDPQHQGIMGPRYEDMFRNAALLVMADPEGGTFIDIPKLFRDPEFLKEKLKHVKDQTVRDFWEKQFPQSQRSNEAGEVTAWFVSKFGAFLTNTTMRNIIGQKKSAFDLRDIMDNKKILLVNLSKGRLGDLNAKLLGMIFVMRFQAAAMSRATIPEDQRVDFSLYVDEFQNFSTDSFATIMSEARKYHLNLIVANQFTTQLTEEIRDAVFGNMGTVVAFRIGQNDVDSLSRYFQPLFDGDDLLRIPNYNAVVRSLVGGVPTQPFSMATLPPLGNPNMKLAEALKQLSAAKYGRPKADIDKEINERMATREAAKPASPFAGPAAAATPWNRPAAPGGFGAPAQRPATKPAAGGSSFLDDWLSKRQARPAVTTPVRAAAPAPTTPPVTAPEPALPLPLTAPQPAQVPTPAPAPAPAAIEPAEEVEADLSQFMPAPKVAPAPEDLEKTIEALAAKKVPGEDAPAPRAVVQPQQQDDDTIFIDADGELHIRN